MKEKLREKIDALVKALLQELGDAGSVPSISLEVPRQAEHGDFATNAAMTIAKRLGKKPRDLAQLLLMQLGDADGLLERAEIAGPGFINFWLKHDRWQSLLQQILLAGDRYGWHQMQPVKKIQVEFVSANPTGPLTLGHGRQAILGDAIVRLLEAVGHKVVREYYFNNGGRQMRVLGESVRARYWELLGKAAPAPKAVLENPDATWPDEVDGLPVMFPRDGYQGEYIGEIASALLQQHGDALLCEEDESRFREAAEKTIFGEIRSTLDSLGIHFDEYYNEISLYENGHIEATLSSLRELGLIYESEGAVWLRATQFGLDRDRVVVKSSGEPTYLLPDIAYHVQKFRRGFDLVVDVQGADHLEQFPFVQRSAGKLGCPEEAIQLVIHQFVTLTSGGEQVKQSTRRANYVTIDELLAEVGSDVFRFFMVQRRAESHLDFDLDLAKDTDWKKNPAYYLQYAHARTYGIERKAEEAGVAMPEAKSVDAAPLVLESELELLKKLAAFPEVVANAAESFEPHHLAYYLREVAGLWNPYLQDGVRHRVISDDPALTQARLGLALAVRTVLANGLRLLGLSTPESM